MEKEIVIDGKNATMGRLASYAAKQTLLGKKVIIVNSNEVVIIGNEKDIISKYQRKYSLGGSSLKGPKVAKSPERLLKRTVRGMLPHKKGRGRMVFREVICYNETPEEYKEVKKIHAGKEKRGKYITLKHLFKVIN
ncbi:MAG TPA: 50S ribosomal protein L13 [Candidatus Nanoarchaeia archaeon]|nr:50S ribosomal protein L13 [Candidatus Nanoarchaeia archaeon]